MKYRIHMQSAIRDAYHVIDAIDQLMANILGAAKSNRVWWFVKAELLKESAA